MIRPSSGTGRGWWLLLGGAAAACALSAAGCKDKKDANAYAPPPPPEVIVAKPVEREVTGYLTYTGVVEASETVELRARVQGFLKSKHFEPGQVVKANDLLFVIDKRQYEAAVAQARAAVRAQEAALQGAENDARLARELADARAGPEIDAVIKAAKRDVVKADLGKAEAELTEALLNLEYCEVRAPIAGKIGRNLVDVGNLVGRGEPTHLATIVAAAPVYVSLDVSESDVLAIRREEGRASRPADLPAGMIAPGQWRPCELALADETEFRFKGRVDFVDPALDATTGTLRVRTRFENTDDRLLPGLFARVRFAMSNRKSLVVPEAALLRDQQGRYAMVVNGKDEVEARRVTIGVLDGTMRVVESGLSADDRVIVLGVLKARPGSKVTPKVQEPPAGAGR